MTSIFIFLSVEKFVDLPAHLPSEDQQGTLPALVQNALAVSLELRPKRAAYGVAGLRSGSGQRDSYHALMAQPSASEPTPKPIPLNI
jgi:hypothetical protein